MAGFVPEKLVFVAPLVKEKPKGGWDSGALKEGFALGNESWPSEAVDCYLKIKYCIQKVSTFFRPVLSCPLGIMFSLITPNTDRVVVSVFIFLERLDLGSSFAAPLEEWN
jgi:hypothetical protein